MMIKRLVLSVLCTLALSVSADEVSTSASEQLSDAYIRTALTYLTYTDAIEGDEPQVLAAALLDAALTLNPGNAQAWSMRAELAQSSADFEVYEKALVRYLDTGIDDDRARFKLIQHRLSHDNTLDAQLREVENLLDSQAGRSLSGPLRSQLASFACSIATELLDERARRKWAVEAARADPANLLAAQTMLGLVIELGGDEVRRGTATVNVIRADPLSPQPRLDLASLLAEEGAYERAAQQLQVVGTRLSPEPLHVSEYNLWGQCLAMSGQDELLLQLLEQFEAALNQPTELPGEATEPAADAEAADQPEPEKVGLPLSLELFRLAVLRDSDDQAQAKVVLDRIVRQLRAAPAADEDQAQAEESKRNLALVASVFGPDLDQAESIVKESGGDAVALGWIALRRGDQAKALEHFKPIAETKPLAACGMAMANAQDDAGRTRLLQNFLDSSSTSSFAALAAGREMLKLETPAQPTTSGKALLALMGKYPESFWLVDLERTPWIDVRLKIRPQRIKPLEPIQAEITLWNTSRFPLAIVADGPISPSAVLTMNAASSGRLIPPTPPIVVDLGRRFSLKANERMIIDTRLDYHQFGTLRSMNPGAPFSFDARLILNPSLSPFGSWRPGGIGAVSEVRDNLIEARPTSQQAVEAWLDQLDSAVVSEKLLAMQRLAALDQQAQQQVVTEQVIQQVTTQLLAAWDGASEAEQAWMILSAVGLETEQTTFPGLLERAKNSESKLVWYALIMTHAIEADSEILKAAIGRQDLPDIARFAERQRRLLRDFAAYQEQQESALPDE
eukprot:g14037.t1